MSPSPGKAARWEVSAAGPPLRTGGRSRLPPPLSTFTTSPTPPLVAIPVNTNQAPALPFTFMSQVSNGCISVSTGVLFPFTDPSPHGLAAGKYFTAYQVLVDDTNINQLFETPHLFQERQRLVLPCRPAAPDIRVSFIKSPPPPAGSEVNPVPPTWNSAILQDLQLAFHPHLGFVSPSASLHHNGFYTCTFEGQGRSEKQMVQIHVTRKLSLNLHFICEVLIGTVGTCEFKSKTNQYLAFVTERGQHFSSLSQCQFEDKGRVLGESEHKGGAGSMPPLHCKTVWGPMLLSDHLSSLKGEGT